ncbi:MAG: LamG-like jellyroll fold domain-containing protein, partial [Bacteroidota bacterium]
MNHRPNYSLSQGSLLFILFAFLLFSNTTHAQTRDGYMDLTSSNGRGIFVNHDGRGAGLGIEGTAFTVESWIYLEANNNNNFNFFRFRNGDARVSLHYRGDQNKTDGPWKIEVKGIGVGETSWTLDYNRNGSAGPDLLQSWHHIAFSSNGSGGVRLYIDGTLLFAWTLTTDDGAISSLFPVSKDGDNNCYIGSESYNSNTEGKFYASEIRIWKT